MCHLVRRLWGFYSLLLAHSQGELFALEFKLHNVRVVHHPAAKYGVWKAMLSKAKPPKCFSPRVAAITRRSLFKHLMMSVSSSKSSSLLLVAPFEAAAACSVDALSCHPGSCNVIPQLQTPLYCSARSCRTSVNRTYPLNPSGIAALLVAHCNVAAQARL